MAKARDGKFIDYTTTEAVTMGVPVVVGNLIGIPNSTFAANENGNFVALQVEGVFELPKSTEAAIEAGDIVTWDASTKSVKKATSGTGNGVAWESATAEATTIMVKINTAPAVTGA